MPTKISNSDDVIDVRDIIARVEELEDSPRLTQDDADTPDDEQTELAGLTALLDELKGNGGDEQWKGDWYPLGLVRDSYFKDYAKELAADTCPWPRDSREAKALEAWPYRCIDWDAAARELQHDYTSIDFDGVTYWYC